MMLLHKTTPKTLKGCAWFLHEWSSCRQGPEEGQIPTPSPGCHPTRAGCFCHSARQQTLLVFVSSPGEGFPERAVTIFIRPIGSDGWPQSDMALPSWSHGVQVGRQHASQAQQSCQMGLEDATDTLRLCPQPRNKKNALLNIRPPHCERHGSAAGASGDGFLQYMMAPHSWSQWGRV